MTDLGKTHFFLVVNTFNGQFGLGTEVVVLDVIVELQLI